uniref:CCHC-type domain-containing protein n=1 Tax=Trichogramma kaykai TaxID=54128 RepID=A0ABD2W292_9HYME
MDQLRYLTDCSTAADMWARLRTIHAEKSDQSVLVLLSQFINAKMDSSASMADYVAKIVSLAQRLKDMDMEQKEPVIIAKILSSIPEKYDNVRTAWYAVPRDKQTLEKLTDHLVNEEALWNLLCKNVNNSPDEEVYMARGNKYHVNSDNLRNVQLNQNFVKSRNCHFCKKPGHWAREFKKKKEFLENKNKSNNYSMISENAWGNDGKAELFNAECLL